jgi:hypothetical protein
MMTNDLRPLWKKAVKTKKGVITSLLLRLGIILGVTLLMIGFVNSELNKSKNAQELSAYGKWVQGMVVERATSGEHSTKITYKYTASGEDGTPQIYQGQVVNDSYDVGDTVMIIYSRRQPSLSWLGDDFSHYANLISFSPSSWIVYIIVIGVGLIFGAFLVNITLPELRLAFAITQDGICTSGTVMELDEVVSYGSKGGRSYKYYVICEYNVMGQIFWLKERISQNRYRQLESSMHVDVRYLPDQPDAARLDE